MIFINILSYISVISFYFYYSLHLRTLHSFPTRRSSDLYSEREIDGSFEPPIPQSSFKSYTRHPGGSCLLDRKSTRLNSSHRTISYAVFCLKKKKTSSHPHFTILNSNATAIP